MNNPLDELTRAFERFPGIGPRQARRFVQFLLQQPPAFRAQLSNDIKTLGSHAASCRRCFRWFIKNGSPEGLCATCAAPRRDASVLFVVEKDADIENIDRSGFGGLYFVLGGTVPLAEEHPERFVRARELLKRVEEDAAKSVLKEIILGLSATSEGDHTRLILQEMLLPFSQKYGFKLTSLGRGLSTGSELEYADPDTISQALGNRR